MASTVAAVMSSSKGPRPKLTDFLIRWGRPKRQTAEEQLAVFKALAGEAQPRT